MNPKCRFFTVASYTVRAASGHRTGLEGKQLWRGGAPPY
jgi:hypothetical protein